MLKNKHCSTRYVPPAHFVISSNHWYYRFQWLTGPFMKMSYAMDSIKFHQHPNPKTTKLAAYSLYTVDTLVGFATMILGWVFLVFSQSLEDLLLNALQLFFILEIDDYVAKVTPNIGLMKEMMVPADCVLPAYIYDPDWFLKGRFFWAAMVIQFGFLSTPAIPVALSFLAYYVTSNQWTIASAVALSSAIPIVG